jgi:hypothetical protein
MKGSTGPSQETANLSKPVDRHLHAYAIAASAAGVGLLALSQPAEAKVIHKVVNVSIGLGSSYTLDLNKIGVGDFTISAFQTGFSGGNFDSSVRVKPIGKDNEVWVTGSALAAELGNNVTIGPSGNFSNRSSIYMVNYFDGKFADGNWAGNVKAKFLGFKFVDLAGKPHYGWARLNVHGPGHVELLDYEYDNTEYTPVKTCKGSSSTSVVDEGSGIPMTEDAVEPSGSPSLGHLAAGAAAIDAWRTGSAATK